MSTPFSKFDWLSAALRGADDISHAQKTVLTVMLTYASSKDGCNIRPGLKRIVEDAACNEKTVRAAVERLLERGYLILQEQGGNEVRKGWANVYRLGYPARLSESEARVPVSTTLDNPQGSHSVPQGSHSVPARVPLSGGQGSQSLGPHPVIDPVIHPGIESFTIDSHEPTGDQAPGILTKKERSRLLDHISYVAHTLGNDCTEEQYQAAEVVLSSDIENFLGREAAEEWDSDRWHVTGRQLERYEAGKKLTQFINYCIRHDIPLARMEGAA